MAKDAYLDRLLVTFELHSTDEISKLTQVLSDMQSYVLDTNI